MTPQEQYTAALSSVKLIDNILLKTTLTANDIARLTANAGHLTDTAAKEGMTNTAVLTAAAARANAAVLAFDKTGTVAQIVSAVNTQALTERDAALAGKATAEAALTVAQAQIATLQSQIDAYTPPAPSSAITVSPRQIRQALTQVGLRTQVEAAVAAGDQALKDWYAYATVFEEDHPAIVAMAAALGVSDASLHDLFLLAASL